MLNLCQSWLLKLDIACHCSLFGSFGKYQNRTESTDTEFPRYRVSAGTDRYRLTEEPNLYGYRRTEPIGSVLPNAQGELEHIRFCPRFFLSSDGDELQHRIIRGDECHSFLLWCGWRPSLRTSMGQKPAWCSSRKIETHWRIASSSVWYTAALGKYRHGWARGGVLAAVPRSFSARSWHHQERT